MANRIKNLAFVLFKEGIKSFFIGWGLSIIFLIIAIVATPNMWDSITNIGSLLEDYAISPPNGGTGTVEEIIMIVKIMGMLFYNSHGIPVVFQIGGMHNTVNIVLEIAQSQGIFFILFITPVLAFLFGGYSLTKGQSSTRLQGAKEGVLLAIPYSAILVIGKFLFSITWSWSILGMSAQMFLGPVLDHTILIAIVLNAAFSSFGGFMGGQNKKAQSSSQQIINEVSQTST